MRARQVLLPAVLGAVVVLATGCGGEAGGDTPGDTTGGEKPAEVSAPATPEAAVKQFAAAVADNDAAQACGLMLEATQATFATDNEAPNCAAAVELLSSEIVDKAAYTSMVPSGLEVDGASAEVSGYCGDGWSTADGGRFEGEGANPNALGTLKLRKVGDGWRIADYTGTSRYSSCGG